MKHWLLVLLLLLLACGGGGDKLVEWDIDVQDVGASLLTHHAGQEVLLTVTCNERGFGAAVYTNIHSDFRSVLHPVTIKFDNDEPVEHLWSYYHFAESGLYKTGVVANDPNAFITQLLNANRLTVDIAVTDTDSIPATWDNVEGFAIAYEAIWRQC